MERGLVITFKKALEHDMMEKPSLYYRRIHNCILFHFDVCFDKVLCSSIWQLRNPWAFEKSSFQKKIG